MRLPLDCSKLACMTVHDTMMGRRGGPGAYANGMPTGGAAGAGRHAASAPRQDGKTLASQGHSPQRTGNSFPEAKEGADYGQD